MPKTQDKVNDILNSIKKTKSKDPVGSDKVPVVTSDIKTKKKVPEIPRGKPKSGRIWKNTKQRFSSVKKTKGAHQTFKQKEALRQKLKEIKEASKVIQEEKKAEKEAQKQRRRDNIKKTEENRIKSEVVQVIKNPAKLKRMKKKQLRFIEKRDTTKVSK